jgi:hypothetical protein
MRAPNEGLPILTVDEEIYWLLSLVVAIVDKLAQLPGHGYAGMLFSRLSRWCPRHGQGTGAAVARHRGAIESPVWTRMFPSARVPVRSSGRRSSLLTGSEADSDR